MGAHLYYMMWSTGTVRARNNVGAYMGDNKVFVGSLLKCLEWLDLCLRKLPRTSTVDFLAMAQKYVY